MQTIFVTAAFKDEMGDIIQRADDVFFGLSFNIEMDKYFFFFCVTEYPSAQVDYTCDGSFQRQNLSRHLSTKKWATCFKDWTMSFFYLSTWKWAIFLVTESLRPEVDHICDGIILKRTEWTTSSSFY